MTAPIPTPATLAAAVRAVEDALCAVQWTAIRHDTDIAVPVDHIARLAVETAAPILAAGRADELAQAHAAGAAAERERGAAALRQLLVEHLLVVGKCWSSCGDPADIVWPDHIAEQWLAALTIARAGTSEADHAAGAAAERERIVAYIDGRRDRIGFSAQVDKGVRWALNSIRMMPVGWQPKVTGACRLDAHGDCRLPTCICACHVARAGTSGDAS